jgi:hypothetical protein
MKRFIFLLILTLCGTVGYGQQTAPAAVAVPLGSIKLLHVYAKGVQIYRCMPDAKDTSLFVWIFQEPKADLFSTADYEKKIGKHYLNAAKQPTWELLNGSMVSGTKLLQAPSPDVLSIPWLLLSDVKESGKGSLAPVNFIQRLNTKGGAAPAKAYPSQKGQLLQVPYTAEYLFYR